MVIWLKANLVGGSMKVTGYMGDGSTNVGTLYGKKPNYALVGWNYMAFGVSS